MGKIMDITGKKFGKLTVIEKADQLKNGSHVWKCKCDCGNYCDVTTRNLNSGRKKSCGCAKGFQRHLVGQRFGKLTVLSDTGEKQKHVKMWLCQCDCGNTIAVRTDCLTGGKVISCGCIAKGRNKIKLLTESRRLEDHTSQVFFKGTVSKNSITGINGVTKLKNSKYRAYIGYKNKIYSLIEDENIEIAKAVREEAENAIKEKCFEEWIEKWRKK